MSPTIKPLRYGLLLPCVLFMGSGALALVYELLWMRELSLLFGSTSQAVSVTLAAFFSGLAAGGWYWGQRADFFPRPLRVYGVMELGVAVSAAGCLAIMPAFRVLYHDVFDLLSTQPGSLLAVKFMLSFMALFPAAFLIGGTLPVVNRIAMQQNLDFGWAASLFYGLNTLGAAAGALLAGFWLPAWLGFRGSYLAAMGMSGVIGLVACMAGRRDYREPGSCPPCNAPAGAVAWREADTYALLSGFGVIALEVLWTRMFAQVLQNSVYTFALILAVCVAGLALGALIAHQLLRGGRPPEAYLYSALIVSALLVAMTPHAFMAATEGLRYVGQGLGWRDYLCRVLLLMTTVLGPALIALGVVFPLLFGMAGQRKAAETRTLGRLLFLNLVGAVGGALAAGFVLLDSFGLWGSIRLLAMLYLVAALAGSRFQTTARAWQRAVPLAGVLLLVSFLDTSRLPIVRVEPLTEGESLLQAWESHAGVVAVVRHGEQLKIKQDNHYTLGGSGSAAAEALQGSLPVLLHTRPETVFALGLGTGITAGATLRHPIRHLDVAELLADAIEAARLYFAPYHFGLFDDARVRVMQEDGRNYLAATGNHYDVIIGDLFVPWHAGAGNLYSYEHFQAVRGHLREGGAFMQWLPAYQLSRAEFAVIAKTLLAVFPQVGLWRGDFASLTPVLGLLAQASPLPLSPKVRLFSAQPDVKAVGGERLLMHYVGRLDAVAQSFQAFPLNRDDNPVVEYRAPITQRLQKRGEAKWLNGMALIDLMEEVRAASGGQDDPYLAQLPEPLRRLPEAGLCQHRTVIEKQEGYLLAAEKSLACVERILGPAE